MTTNQERAAEVLKQEINKDPQVAREMFGDEHAQYAEALAAAGLLAPDPVVLAEGDRNFVIDTLIKFRQNANILGTPGMTEAWESAANAFAAHTTIKEKS